MSRTDPDLIAVRELPPGPVEPSDEAVARVWNKIATRSAPRPVTRRLWVPIAAAAAVVALVGAGIFILRPRTVSQPAFTSDRETVTRVIGELRDRAVTAEPVPRGQGLVLYTKTEVIARKPDGFFYARSCDEWLAADTFMGWKHCDSEEPSPDLLAARRETEAAGKPAADSDVVKDTLRLYLGPADPTAIRAHFVELRKGSSLESDDLKVWNGLLMVMLTDRTQPVDRLRGLFEVMAALPVSVGDVVVDGRRLVVVRYVEHQQSIDLLFDPATGRFAGAQGLLIVPAGEKPSAEPGPVVSPYPTQSGGVVPEVGRRLDGTQLGAGVTSREVIVDSAVVESIGDRA